MATRITTPPGRLVWGNPARSKNKTDQKTRQPILKEGKPVEQWAFGVAFPKQEFSTKIWPSMDAEIRSGYPSGPPSQFSFKYKDGDTNDRSGKPYSAREGYGGHYILNISTEAFPPPIYKMGSNGQYVQLQPNEIKTGDYVVLVLDLQINVPTNITHTPGLYVNPVAILHVGYGQEIQNTPDPTTLFGQQPQFQLPPGASATPLAPVNMPMMPGTMPSPGQQQGYPQQPQQPPGYQPPPDPRFTGQPPQGYPQQPGYGPPAGAPAQPGAPQPGQMPGYTPPQAYAPQPGQMPGYTPPQAYAPQPGQMPGYAPPAGAPPAYDFTRNAGQQPPQGYMPPAAPPVGMPPQAYAPQPGQMPGYAPQPQQGYPSPQR